MLKTYCFILNGLKGPVYVDADKILLPTEEKPFFVLVKGNEDVAEFHAKDVMGWFIEN